MMIVRLIDTLIKRLCIAGMVLSAVLVFAMAIIGTADVIGTNVFDQPVPGTLEISETMFAVVIFSGFGYVVMQARHITIDIFIDAAPDRVRRICHLFALALSATVFAVVAWQSFEALQYSLLIRESANSFIPFPLYPARAVVFAGCLIASLECLRQLTWALLGQTQSSQDPEELDL